ncbi:MAG: hypothetical protein Q8N99_04440 [Nanoarchaeota archaeon]|nr:hypothetical protein [Nanoarchaeota archaeon]
MRFSILDIRNKTRKKALSQKAIEEVHELVSRPDIGIKIETSNKSKKQILDEIKSYIPKK